MKKKENRSWLIRILIAIYRFFIPKDFKAELAKGAMRGEELIRGKISPKVVPTWWIGKLVRKLVDPKHEMKVGKKDDK